MATAKKEQIIPSQVEEKNLKKIKKPSQNSKKIKSQDTDILLKPIIKKTIKPKKINLNKVPKNALISKGGRKSAVATAFLWENLTKENYFIINNKPLKEYFFNSQKLLSKVLKPFIVTGKNPSFFAIKIKVSGSGVASQASAVAHSIAVALAAIDVTYKVILRAEGMLTRDARAVQSKSTGLRKSRKSEQFSKR